MLLLNPGERWILNSEPFAWQSLNLYPNHGSKTHCPTSPLEEKEEAEAAKAAKVNEEGWGYTVRCRFEDGLDTAV